MHTGLLTMFGSETMEYTAIQCLKKIKIWSQRMNMQQLHVWGFVLSYPIVFCSLIAS